jgi:putative ABC transport system permease protein
LREGERVVAGRWPLVWHTNDAVVPVSLEKGIARDLNVGLGDKLVFDVQGVPVATEVASLREVEWKRVQPNFFVIFPPGPIDDAPAFNVFVTRTESAAQSADLQKAVALRFPNVSIIDLGSILKSVDAIIGKAEDVVRFMSAFTLLTGLVVLAGALATSRRQRIQESMLLRTLGATKRQLMQILAVEYAVLGILAGLAGTVLSLGTAWGICHYMLKIPFLPSLGLLPVVWLGIAGLTLATGLIGTGKILDHPPLEVLRAEGYGSGYG